MAANSMRAANIPFSAGFGDLLPINHRRIALLPWLLIVLAALSLTVFLAAGDPAATSSSINVAIRDAGALAKSLDCGNDARDAMPPGEARPDLGLSARQPIQDSRQQRMLLHLIRLFELPFGLSALLAALAGRIFRRRRYTVIFHLLGILKTVTPVRAGPALTPTC